MALTASPSGFLLRYHPTGQSRAKAMTIDAAYNTPIGYGDAVILDTNGTITVGTATNDLIGVFAGVQYKDSTGKPTYSKRWPGAVSGATEIVAWVYDDALNVFEVQVETGGSGYVQAAIGAQADLVAGVPNAVTGQSTMALEATIDAAGAQGQFRIIGFGSDGVYDATLNPFPTILVQIAQHQFVSNKVGI
ncbi:MAG: hypothetical protein KA974_01875 [Saprospiraceae bacterium]|nr:hypothetical protein [Saprospiraceae bacterium]